MEIYLLHTLLTCKLYKKNIIKPYITQRVDDLEGAIKTLAILKTFKQLLSSYWDFEYMCYFFFNFKDTACNHSNNIDYDWLYIWKLLISVIKCCLKLTPLLLVPTGHIFDIIQLVYDKAESMYTPLMVHISLGKADIHFMWQLWNILSLAYNF